MLNDRNTYNWILSNAHIFNRSLPKTTLGPTRLSGNSINLVQPKSATIPTYNQPINYKYMPSLGELSKNPSLKLDYMAPKQIPSFASNFKEGLTNSINKFGEMGKANPQVVGKGIDVLSSIIPSYTQDPTTQAINQGFGAVGDIAMAIPGGQVVGAAIKGAGLVGKGLNALTGGDLTMDKSTSGIDKILSSDYLNWTPMGVINKVGSSQVEGTDEDIAAAAQGYGEAEKIEDYERGLVPKIFDKIGSIFKKNKKTKTQLQKLKVAGAESRNVAKAFAVQTAEKQRLAGINSTGNTINRNITQLQGGLRPEDMRLLAAKKGTKLALKNIKRKVATKFQQGGKVNVIVDGALHARKHNMDLEDVTNKGVPVVSFEEGGQVTQHAEVEREELILHKELTNTLEELQKKYKEGDENALIEAGKLLAYEILENTEDNTGTLNKINYE